MPLDQRQLIAALALSGMVGNQQIWLANDAQATKEAIKTTEVFARDAVHLADALLKYLAP